MGPPAATEQISPQAAPPPPLTRARSLGLARSTCGRPESLREGAGLIILEPTSSQPLIRGSAQGARTVVRIKIERVARVCALERRSRRSCYDSEAPCRKTARVTTGGQQHAFKAQSELNGPSNPSQMVGAFPSDAVPLRFEIARSRLRGVHTRRRRATAVPRGTRREALKLLLCGSPRAPAPRAAQSLGLPLRRRGMMQNNNTD